jgi:hypothetical protein
MEEYMYHTTFCFYDMYTNAIERSNGEMGERGREVLD